MSHDRIENIIIVGGGTAGWISAAALAKLLPQHIKITLIESDTIGTVGVGEATIPQIRRLNGILGLNENEFLKATFGTFKLGIEFSNWGQIGDSYIHTFGDVGLNIANLQFHHYWLKAKSLGLADNLWDFSLHKNAIDRNKFSRLDRVGQTSMTGLSYAFHFDAGLYAKYLRQHAEKANVTRIEGLVQKTNLNSETGHIESVELDSGKTISGDFFIDCSGFRGLLIEKALGIGYQDWSKWLPCDRAIAIPSKRTEPISPYTKSIAHESGWQWQIPLQHRTGNGHVYCSDFSSDDKALDILLSNLDGDPITDPNHLRFKTGKRDSFWHKNCVAIGLSSGFMEPLESTSIHLIQSNISRLIELFPYNTLQDANINEYNRQVSHEYELIRDFLVLHYYQTQREDSEFWKYCKNMEVPTTLKDKLNLFEQSGRLYKDPEDLFRESSWVQVMIGQGLTPKTYHPMADRLSNEQIEKFMNDVKAIISQTVNSLPDHDAFIRNHCAADLQ